MKYHPKVLSIFAIGMLCSLATPFSIFGLVLGLFPVTLNTVLICLIFKKELFKDEDP